MVMQKTLSKRRVATDAFSSLREAALNIYRPLCAAEKESIWIAVLIVNNDIYYKMYLREDAILQ